VSAPRRRSTAPALLALSAAVAVLLAVVVVRLAGGDDPRTGSPVAAPVADGVVVEVPDARGRRLIEAYARRIGAEDRPAVRALGQAVVVRVRPRRADVLVRAGGRAARFSRADDPRLQAFVARALGG
jgi:putative intracellular protease/amidase